MAKSASSVPTTLQWLLAASSTEDGESGLSTQSPHNIGMPFDELRTTDHNVTIADGTTPSVEQKLFLVMSVALATVCFFTNAVQIGVFLRGSSIQSIKSLLLMSQACSGMVAATVVAFPIHVISVRGGIGATDEGFNACYIGHSAVILLSLFTSLGTATLLLLDQHLHYNYHAKYVASGSNVLNWGLAVAAMWMLAALIAMLPWFGWNTWLAHDARCHLSTVWPLSFTAFVTFMVALHVALTLLMWASGRATKLQIAHRNLNIQENKTEEPLSNRSEACVRFAGWLISLSAIVPVLGHVVLASSCAASTQCMQSARHYHEDSASLPWASLLLAAAAVASPLLYVFSDDKVSSATLLLLSHVCCMSQRAAPTQCTDPNQHSVLSIECATDSHVTTSDTVNLVAE